MRGKIASMRALTAAMFVFGSVPAQASQQTGTVYAYAIAVNGSPAAVTMSASTRTAVPACATDTVWSIPLNAANQNALIAGVMTAMAQGRTIDVVGTGACDPIITTREQISYIVFH
jgi:hypothetical protein